MIIIDSYIKLRFLISWSGVITYHLYLFTTPICSISNGRLANPYLTKAYSIWWPFSLIFYMNQHDQWWFIGKKHLHNLYLPSGYCQSKFLLTFVLALRNHVVIFVCEYSLEGISWHFYVLVFIFSSNNYLEYKTIDVFSLHNQATHINFPPGTLLLLYVNVVLWYTLVH